MRRLGLLALLACSIAHAQLYPLGPNVGTLQVPYNDGSGNWAALSVSGSGSICMTISCAMTTPNLGVPSALDLLNATDLQATALPASGVTAGSCTSCNLTVDSYGRVTAASNGGGGAVATVTETGKTATLSETVLCNDTSGLCNVAGAQYQISWNIWGSGTACSSVTAGEVTLTLYWTDENGTAHAAVVMMMQTQTSATAIANDAYFHFETSLANEGSAGVFVISSNGAAPIEFGQVYTACTTGTGTYNTRIAVTRLQ